MIMLRILILLPLALAIGGCASNPSGYIGLGTQRPADVSVAEWRGDLAEPARRGVRDPKSPDVRPRAARGAISVHSGVTQAAAAQSQPRANPGQPKAKAPCKPREHWWQRNRPKVCP